MNFNYINIFSHFSTQCETTQDWRTSMHIWLLFTSVTWLYFHGWITKVHNMTESAVEFQVTATKISLFSTIKLWHQKEIIYSTELNFTSLFMVQKQKIQFFFFLIH